MVESRIVRSLDSYAREVASALCSVSEKKIDEMVNCLVAASIQNKKIWIIGNGGSAATASHFAADLMRKNDRVSYKVRAICLSESSTRVTAIGNDFGFERIFERQVHDLAEEGDVLIALSASGNSPNLINGVSQAKKMGLRVLSMVGFEGGSLKAQSDFCAHFITKNGEYEIAEDAHSISCHYIAMSVRSQLEFESSRQEGM